MKILREHKLNRKNYILSKKFFNKNLSLILYITITQIFLLINFSSGNYPFNGDTVLQLNYIYATYHFSYSWFYGPMASQNLLLIFAVPALLQLFGVSIFEIEFFIYSITFVVIGLGVSLLYRSLSNYFSRLWEFVLIIFYAFNYYSISVIWIAFEIRTVYYALTPLTLFLYSRSIKSNKFSSRVGYLLLIAIIFSYYSLYIIPIIMLIIIIFSFYLHVYGKVKKLLQNILLIVLIYVTVNFYYIIPTILILSKVLTIHSVSEPSSLFFAFPKAQNLINSIRLLSFEFIWYWGWGYPNYSWTLPVLNNLLLILCSFGPFFIFIYWLLMIKLKKLSQYLSIITIFLIGIFVSSASGSPLGDIIFKALSLTHLVSLYEIPFEAFGLMIVIAYLLIMIDGSYYLTPIIKLSKNMFSIDKIFNLKKIKNFFKSIMDSVHISKHVGIFIFISNKVINKSKTFLSILLVLMILINTYPVVTEQIFPQQINRGGGIPVPSSFISVPPYYNSFNNYALRLNHNYSLLVLPPFSPASHIWHPNNETSSNPIIQYYSGNMNIINLNPNNQIIETVNYLISNNISSTTFTTILSKMSVKYILIEEDWLNLVSYEKPLGFYTGYISNVLNSSNSPLSIIHSFGNLTLLEIKNPKPEPIYQLIQYGYYVPGNINNITSFYKFPINYNKPIIEEVSGIGYSNNRLVEHNFINKLNNTQIQPGNYSIYTIASELAKSNLNTSNNLTGQIEGKPFSVFLNSNMSLPILHGQFPVYNFTTNSSHLNVSFNNPSIDVLNQSQIISKAKSCNNISSSSTELNCTNFNMFFNRCIPSSFNAEFNFSFYSNPKEIGYSGVSFVNHNDSLEIVVREGSYGSSGGILIIQNVSGKIITYYSNLVIPLNGTQKIFIAVNNGTIGVILDSKYLNFKSFGAPVTDFNYSPIFSFSNFTSIKVFSNNLPISINNFNITHKEFFFQNSILLQDPPNFDAYILNYSLNFINPSTISVSAAKVISNDYLITYSNVGTGWRVGSSLYPFNIFAFELKNSNCMNTSFNEQWALISKSENSSTIYIFYEQQSIANVSLLVTFTSMIGFLSFFVYLRKKGR